jgi:hypothetical protein
VQNLVPIPRELKFMFSIRDKAMVVYELDNGSWVNNPRWDKIKIENYEVISLCNLFVDDYISELSQSGINLINSFYTKLIDSVGIDDKDQDVKSIVDYISKS